jgi:mycoredoxin
MTTNQGPITVYSTTWCGDCRRTKHFLDRWGVPYKEIDIEVTPGAADKVVTWSGGRRVVPTIVVGDRVLFNPGVGELAGALGIDA